MLRSIRLKRAPERPSSPAGPRSQSATDAPSEQRESNQWAGSGAAPGSATVSYVEGANARRPSTPDGAGLEFSAGAGDRFPAVVPIQPELLDILNRLRQVDRGAPVGHID